MKVMRRFVRRRLPSKHTATQLEARVFFSFVDVPFLNQVEQRYTQVQCTMKQEF
jgi:hypothetical protein